MAFDTLYDLCRSYYNSMLHGDILSVSEEVHGEILTLHIYRLEDNFVFDSAETVKSVFSLCTAVDTYTQVLLGRNITVNEGVTLTPPYRCKGLVIFDKGTFTNNGTVSMTARGCNAVGQNIYLLNNRNGTYEFVPAVGASATSGYGYYGDKLMPVQHGNSGVGRQTGGGGAGGTYYSGVSHINSQGGEGTSYSGGAGGGAVVHSSATSKTNWGNAVKWKAGGGSGYNGDNYGKAGVGLEAYPNGNYAISQNNSGTGGLLIFFTTKIINNGDIQAKGVSTSTNVVNSKISAHGGASGGGSINIFGDFIGNKPSVVGGKGAVTSLGSFTSYPQRKTTSGNGGDGTCTISILFPHYAIIDDNKLLKFYKNQKWDIL